MKKITIKEVAQIAGVAPSTVSRVISNDSRISEKTRQKVHKVMEELHYYPNTIARSLAKKKTNTIGLIMPSCEEDVFMNPFFQESLRGINQVTSHNSYDITIITNHHGENNVEAIKRIINGGSVDGIILTRSSIGDECIEYLHDRKFPYVLIGSCLEYQDIPSVDNDNELASFELTRLLIEKGKNKIAFIGGHLDSVVMHNRYKGYKKALCVAGIHNNPNYFITDSFTEKSGYRLMNRLISLQDKPDGIIVADDLMCLGVLQRLKEEGIKVPEELMIASFNNSYHAKYSNPSITSTDINSVELGKKACEKLLKLMGNNHEGYTKEIVKHKIIERESTKS